MKEAADECTKSNTHCTYILRNKSKYRRENQNVEDRRETLHFNKFVTLDQALKQDYTNSPSFGNYLITLLLAA